MYFLRIFSCIAMMPVFTSRIKRWSGVASLSSTMQSNLLFILIILPYPFGDVRAQISKNEMKTFYVSGGILEVQPNEVTILSDTALREDDLDEERALEAERQAKEAMKNSDNEIDASKAKTELMQAAAQLRLIKKLRSNTKK